MNAGQCRRFRDLCSNKFLRRRCGFSLLELVVALLVASILLAVALPSYQRYVLRMHRADAVRSLLAATACQERHRAASGYYDTTRCLPAEDNDSYAFRFEPADTPQTLSYRILAVRRAGSGDDPCADLWLDQSGQRGTQGDLSAVGACWGGR